jgi:hypothetical protein
MHQKHPPAKVAVSATASEMGGAADGEESSASDAGGNRKNPPTSVTKNTPPISQREREEKAMVGALEFDKELSRDLSEEAKMLGVAAFRRSTDSYNLLSPGT